MIGRIGMSTVAVLMVAACGGSGNDASTGAPTTTTDAPTAEGAADLIVHGGPVVTMDEADTVAEALAVVDGKIAAVGSSVDILSMAGDTTHVIDLAGRTAMPGIVEPHTHRLQGVAPDEAAMLEGQSELLAGGITTAGMPTVLPDQLPAFEALDATGEIVVRTLLYLSWNDNCGVVVGDPWAFEHTFSRDLTRTLSIAGVKVFADGGSCDGPAVSFEYLDTAPAEFRDNGWVDRGALFVTADQVAEVARRTDEAGGALVVHAIGDVAIDTVLDGYAAAGDLLGGPHRIDHNSWASLLPAESLARYDELGLSVAVQFMPWSNGCDPDVARRWHDTVPVDALTRVEDWPALVAANPELRLSWHGDGPWIPGRPLQQAFSLVTPGYADPDGTICYPDAWSGRSTMPVDAALRMLTIDAAAAAGVDDQVGSLEVGKLADLVVLAADPFDVDPEVGLATNGPLVTIIGGEAVHCVEDGCDLVDGSAGDEPSPSTSIVVDDTGSWTMVDHPVVAAVRASLEYQPAPAAVDGDVDHAWVSGDSSPQWIELDLGETRHLRELRLTVDQDPPGRTVHEIYGGAHDDPGRLLATIDRETAFGDVLVVPIDAEIRYLRIHTADSPSWVSWGEIELDVG